MELNIYHDWREHYIEVHVKEAGCLQLSEEDDGRRRSGNDGSICDLHFFAAATCKHLLRAAAAPFPLNCKFLNSLI